MENGSPSRYLLAVAAEVIRRGEIRNLFTLRLNVNQTMRQLSSRKYFFGVGESGRLEVDGTSKVDYLCKILRSSDGFLLFSKQG